MPPTSSTRNGTPLRTIATGSLPARRGRLPRASTSLSRRLPHALDRSPLPHGRSSAIEARMKKASFLTLHRRVALAFAPLILLQAITGSMLLFREPLARLLDPAAMTSRAQGPAAQVVDLAMAAERGTGKRINRLFLPRSEGSVALARMQGESVPYIAAL